MNGQGTILVVEDEAIIARDIQSLLKGLGYSVVAAVASGGAALEAVRAHGPDLVLMDIRIAGPMDGIEAAEVIRERFGTPVVYLTSHSDEATVSRATRAGAYGFVLKPFNDRDLRIAVEVALQKRAIEERLEVQERWFSTTLKSIGDAVIATDPKQRVTFMNAVAERISGWASKDAVGRDVHEVFCLLDEATGAPLESPLTRALRDGFAVEMPRNVSLSRKGGERRTVDDSAAPIVDSHGTTLGGVIVFRDVTERRALERRLARSEHLAAIATLASGLAHEVNNPLQYIVSNVTFAADRLREVLPELLAVGPAGSAVAAQLTEVSAALEDAREGSRRAHRIVHDMKGFARSDGAARSTVDLPPIIDGAIRVVESVTRNRAHVRRIYRTTPLVEANEGQLAQVFTNLILNAVQAVPEGDRSEVVVHTYTDDAGRAVAEVSDSGPGIPKDILSRIFDPFFTTKPPGQGTGLGLSIAHSVVTALDGEISVESQPGKGATFRVALLPVVPSLEGPAGEPTALDTRRRGRVLLIDDEPAILRATSRLLRRSHDAFACSTAQEALDRIAAGETFDVILCDLTMEAMSGLEFVHALGQVRSDLAARVVFLTGGAATARAEGGVRATTNRVIDKPVDLATLLRVVDEYVRREDTKAT